MLLIEKLELYKKELEEFVRWRTQGAILRCKARWYNEGEKNSKYFLNLEKRHYKLNTISQLQINENEFVTSDTGILEECETFYKTLYRSQDIFYRFLRNSKGDKIKRTVLINDYENGGLKMVDLSSFNKSLKTTWIGKYLDTSNHGKWKEIVFLELEKHGDSLIFKVPLTLQFVFFW